MSTFKVDDKILGTEVRVGDRIRVVSSGLTIDGTVGEIYGDHLYTSEGGGLGPTREVYKLLSRPLPTKAGSVIVNATIRGVPGQTAFLIYDSFGATWRTAERVGGSRVHSTPDLITDWTLGKVVPA